MNCNADELERRRMDAVCTKQIDTALEKALAVAADAIGALRSLEGEAQRCAALAQALGDAASEIPWVSGPVAHRIRMLKATFAQVDPGWIAATFPVPNGPADGQVPGYVHYGPEGVA